MTTFRDLLQAQPIDLDAVATHLDSLSHEERVTQVRAVPGKLQGRLFAAAQGYRGLEFDSFVPSSQTEGTFVRHYGKNSLPVFSVFEKRFARPKAGSPVLWGYNFGTLNPVIGPGHFVMRTGPEEGELHVDYFSIPSERLEGAPALARNDRGVSNLIYGHMIDVLRGVSDHVTIGRAIKKGRDTPNYFLLCREA